MLDIYDLLNYLNSNNKDATYSKIIIYLLTHLNEVQSLTISEIAKKCFVSPATLTRFCHHFNLPSFPYLREVLGSLSAMKSHNGLRMREQELLNLKNDPKNYLTSYGQEIIDSIHDVIATIDIGKIDSFLEEIHSAEEILIIGYSSTLELAKDMQISFLSNRKLIFVGETEAIQRQFVRQLQKKSMVIVISSYGTLLNKSSKLIQEIISSPAQSILLTQHTQNTLTNLFDQVINVTKTNYVRIGSYPLTFFIDYISRRYASLYC